MEGQSDENDKKRAGAKSLEPVGWPGQGCNTGLCFYSYFRIDWSRNRMGAVDGELYNCTSCKVTSGLIGGRSESKNMVENQETRSSSTVDSGILGTPQLNILSDSEIE